MTPTPHPVIPLPTRKHLEAWGADAERHLAAREELIKLEKVDQYSHGFNHLNTPSKFPHWKAWAELIDNPDNTRLFLFGGNRSGKTEFMARHVITTMIEKPGSIIWVCGLSAESSVQVQQSAIYRYIPPNWKNAPTGVRRVRDISFSPKNGFTGNNFIAPNGSQCWFKNYTMDSSRLEGGSLDLAWCDELVPPTWVETLKFRTVDRKGQLVVSFTPIEGYTPVVKEAMDGHLVTEWRDVEPEMGMEGNRMPYIGKTRHGEPIMWFHSNQNPYLDYKHFISSAMRGKTRTEKEIRGYGYVKNPIVGMFPRFGSHNIVSRDKVPTKGTNYMCVDPTGGERNWFMVWVRVDDLGRHWVYREWPDRARYGDWAEPSNKLDGKPGPAQKADCGRSLTEYRTMIRHLERGETAPVERFIDPRAGKSSVLSEKEGNYSLIDTLAMDVMDRNGELKEAGMVFTPSANTEISEGVQAINSLLYYNHEEPVSVYNEPRLYVSEDCGNLAYCLREWTGEDGQKGATKDPCDTLRYLMMMDPCYIPPGKPRTTGGGTY